MDFLWILFRLFTMALSMHRAACAAASAGTAGAAADMPACLSVKDQPAYDQSNYDQKDRRNDDGSDICLYPEQHNVSAPFFYLFLRLVAGADHADFLTGVNSCQRITARRAIAAISPITFTAPETAIPIW